MFQPTFNSHFDLKLPFMPPFLRPLFEAYWKESVGCRGFFFVPFVTNFAGPYDQVLPLKPQPKGTAPFKENPFGNCGRGQERGGDIIPQCNLPLRNKRVQYSTDP